MGKLVTFCTLVFFLLVFSEITHLKSLPEWLAHWKTKLLWILLFCANWYSPAPISWNKYFLPAEVPTLMYKSLSYVVLFRDPLLLFWWHIYLDFVPITSSCFFPPSMYLMLHVLTWTVKSVSQGLWNDAIRILSEILLDL
jgi:hypothetical protein